MQRIKSVGVFSVGIYVGVAVFAFVLIVGLVGMLASNAGINQALQNMGIELKVNYLNVGSFGSLLLAAIGGGLGGFVQGVILAVVFNAISSLSGGIKVKIEK